MVTKEAKALTTKWLRERDFRPINLPHWPVCNTYIHPMGNFNVFIAFYKDTYSYRYLFNVGCLFDDCLYGDAIIDVRNLTGNVNKENDSQGIFYSDLSDEQYLKCLDEMFDKYLKPYYKYGVKYLKKIISRGNKLLSGEVYSVSIGARKKINAMFGLHTKSC